jgi:hypothetical protein
VLVGPPVGAPPPRCLTFLSSSCTPPLTTGPCCRTAPPVSRVALRRPRPAALPCPRNSVARAPRYRPLCPGPPLSLPFPFLRVARPSRPLPLARPLIWRSHWCLTPLRSKPELELPSFSTAYTSASPAPTTGDPSSSPVLIRAPPPPLLHGVTLPSATIVPI